jgi:1-acyl-sn-glycerol-3-phosphate acyltransferase
MSIFDQGNQPFSDEGLARHIEEALKIEKPAAPMQALSYSILQRLYKPTLVNSGNIPEEPCLFIGNHSLFALDGMVLAPVMYFEEGRFLRPLGDRFLWNSTTESLLLKQGAVIGHPQVCSALMDAGKDLLVFPGGAHEATKTAAQRYTLQWKERHGFVRLAAQHGYTIMPFAMVGPDEFYSHLLEGEDIPATAVGQLLTRMGVLNENTRTDMLPPIPRGALGTLLPKPQRCYIQFGEPVRLAAHKNKKTSKKKLLEIRDAVGTQIEDMLPELLLIQEQDRSQDGFLRRLLTK